MAPTVLHAHALRLWTHFCARGVYMRGASPLVGANLGWQQLLILLFLLILNFRSRSACAGNCREGAGDAGRTVGAMDGAI
ncbi:hypothetical protein, partial [uncultured Stenotrophomonas sp.]|uniref:hypothetical protein n=1 Tax=uncultured Stenotrophomonas sp. TaxID=165438 RepID=UPI0025E09DDD